MWPLAVASPLRRRRRVLALTVTVALGSAGLGWWAGRAIQSPDEVARNAAAPPAAPITVPVQRQRLESAVVVRGDVTFAQAAEVTLDPDIGDGTLGTQVVTGRVPQPGSPVGEGDVLLEVSGRPVFLLDGVLPTYRPLRPGSEGPDVRQLETALRRLGLFTAVPDATYDARTSAALDRLYRDAGYDPIGPTEQERQQLAAAETSLKAAQSTLRQAEEALAEASRPPPTSAVLAAEGAVARAERMLALATAALDEAVASGADAATIAALEADVAAAADQLAVARAQLAELTAPPDTRALAAAVAAATAEVEAARSVRDGLQAAQGVRLPRGEVVFVPSLPRRIGEVRATVGGTPQGAVLQLTGASVQVDAALSADEQRLVRVGARARLDDEASGIDLAGAVSAVATAPGTDGAPPGSYHLRVTPEGGDPATMAGLNLRVTIPIEATSGEVLTVPLSALVTDAGGVVRVRVAREGGFTDVVVRVGLAAGGFAEVVPVDGSLAAGDLVVVGTQR